MNTRIESLKDLFEEEVQRLYSAEDQLIRALPDLEGNADHKELKSTFTQQLDRAHDQRERLGKIADERDIKLAETKDEGMVCLLKEAYDRMDRADGGSPKDASMILAAQRALHYVVAGYGACHHYAKLLNYEQAADHLQTTLTEKKESDKELTKMAKGAINVEAAQLAD